MKRPTSLTIVAWFFIASGVWAAISIAAALLLEMRINLDIEILGLWIGPGLLRHEARYRAWALRLLVLGFCLAPVAVLILLIHPRPLGVKIFGRPVGAVPFSAATAALALFVGVSVWQYWVLRRPSVRALFVEPTVENPEASV